MTCDKLIVGGHAVAYHGYPRMTGDIDVFIEGWKNARKLVAVLDQFGFGSLGLTPKFFWNPARSSN